MEKNITRCGECPHCRKDMPKKVEIDKVVNDKDETVETIYATHYYCRHGVKLVGLDWYVCDYIKHLLEK